jgi:beta-glucanase (GH16 family)
MLLSPVLLVILTACGITGGMGGSDTGSDSPSTYLQTAPTSTDSDQQWKLVWQDDFTGKGLPKNWSFLVDGNGFSDHSLAWFSDSNATLTGHGGLVITAKKGGSGHTCWYGPCKYTSADISTSFAQEYGRFEARIKLPNGRGLWPGFWMVPLGTKANPVLPGEIDIIEVNNQNPDEVSGYAHDGPIFNHKAEKLLASPPSSQFHVYGVDWTPRGITWTLDGKPYGHINAYKNWPFDRPFIMWLTLAVGGTWPGSPTADTVFPAKMQVSWVRVYKMANLSLHTSLCSLSRHEWVSLNGVMARRLLLRIFAFLK